MKSDVTRVLAMVFAVTIVYVIVRPDSKAAELFKALGALVTGLIGTVTNYKR